MLGPGAEQGILAPFQPKDGLSEGSYPVDLETDSHQLMFREGEPLEVNCFKHHSIQKKTAFFKIFYMISRFFKIL